MIRRTPDLVLGLPTGRTPIPLYEALVARRRSGDIDFRRVSTFNLDEFCGLHARDPRSYHAFMRRHLVDHLNLDRRRVHVPNGAAHDWRREAAAYERAIERAGGLDVCVIGIGRNGHIGFNEPADRLDPRTHRVKLRKGTRRDNAHVFGGDWRRVPAYALSMGVGTILGARAVVLLATGRAKAAIVHRALTGPVSTRVPASLVQLHPNAMVVLDRAAAARFSRRAGSSRQR